jgi:hypothetical protein
MPKPTSLQLKFLPYICIRFRELQKIDTEFFIKIFSGCVRNKEQFFLN